MKSKKCKMFWRIKDSSSHSALLSLHHKILLQFQRFCQHHNLRWLSKYLMTHFSPLLSWHNKSCFRIIRCPNFIVSRIYNLQNQNQSTVERYNQTESPWQMDLQDRRREKWVMRYLESHRKLWCWQNLWNWSKILWWREYRAEWDNESLILQNI